LGLSHPELAARFAELRDFLDRPAEPGSLSPAARTGPDDIRVAALDRVHVRYRRDDGQFADRALDRSAADDVIAGLPVREFRSY
jgi:hypothetical protein